jgi:hypothetical protein
MLALARPRAPDNDVGFHPTAIRRTYAERKEFGLGALIQPREQTAR